MAAFRLHNWAIWGNRGARYSRSARKLKDQWKQVVPKKTGAVPTSKSLIRQTFAGVSPLRSSQEVPA